MEKTRLAVVAEALAGDVREAVRLSRAGGFSGVQVEAYGAVNLPELSISGCRDFKHLLAVHEQELVALRVDIGAKGFSTGADVDRVLARLEKGMAAAAGLGTRLMGVDIGPLPNPPRQSQPRPAITPQQAGLILLPSEVIASSGRASTGEEMIPAEVDPVLTAQVDGALMELGQRADRYGVVVAFRSELAGFAALERALKAADCPWFGVDLDPVAVLQDEWDMDEVFSRLGMLIKSVRARDALRGTDRRTRPAGIGQGSVDWGELMADLDEVGYRGWITVDPMELGDRVAAARAGGEYLKRIGR
jgi:sugar phosphate isomerase/epimerase